MPAQPSRCPLRAAMTSGGGALPRWSGSTMKLTRCRTQVLLPPRLPRRQELEPTNEFGNCGIHCIALSPGGELLATGGTEPADCVVLHVPTMQPVQTNIVSVWSAVLPSPSIRAESCRGRHTLSQTCKSTSINPGAVQFRSLAKVRTCNAGQRL